MSSVSFLYVASSNDESEAFRMIRKKHMQEASIFDDNFYLTQIFKYLSDTYNSFGLSECFKTKKRRRYNRLCPSKTSK